jgi:hypothetical protein
MLWQFIIAGTKEPFEGHTHPQTLPKIHPQAWGVVIHPFEALAWSARPHMWGARGPFLPAVAMVVAVVTLFVFCAMATEKAIKSLKLAVCWQKKYL